MVTGHARRVLPASVVTAGLLAAWAPGAAAQADGLAPIGDVYCHAAGAEPRYFHSGVDRPARASGDDWWPDEGAAQRLGERPTLVRLATAFVRHVADRHGVDVLLSPRCERTAPGAADTAIAMAAYARGGELVRYGTAEKTAVDWTPDFEAAFRGQVAAAVGPPTTAGRSEVTEPGAAETQRVPQSQPAPGLHAAAAAGDVAAAAAAIAAGADVRGRNAARLTPLDVAAAADAAGVVDLLVAHGVDPALLDRSLRERPLHRAARADAAGAAAALLTHGAPVDIVNAAGETPLHAAAGANAAAAAVVLLAHGANAEARDRAGRTPRDAALAAGAAAVAALLQAP